MYCYSIFNIKTFFIPYFFVYLIYRKYSAFVR